MTVRWKTGKEPTVSEIKAAITNSVSKFLDTADVQRIAEAVQRLYRNREEHKS